MRPVRGSVRIAHSNAMGIFGSRFRDLCSVQPWAHHPESSDLSGMRRLLSLDQSFMSPFTSFQQTVLLLNCAQKTPPHQFQVFLIRRVIMCWDDPFHQQIRILKVPEPSLFRGIRMNVPWVIPHMWLISVQVDFDLEQIKVPDTYLH